MDAEPYLEIGGRGTLRSRMQDQHYFIRLAQSPSLCLVLRTHPGHLCPYMAQGMNTARELESLGPDSCTALGPGQHCQLWRDTGSVTIFGESAGGVNVSVLVSVLDTRPHVQAWCFCWWEFLEARQSCRGAFAFRVHSTYCPVSDSVEWRVKLSLSLGSSELSFRY